MRGNRRAGCGDLESQTGTDAGLGVIVHQSPSEAFIKVAGIYWKGSDFDCFAFATSPIRSAPCGLTLILSKNEDSCSFIRPLTLAEHPNIFVPVLSDGYTGDSLPSA